MNKELNLETFNEILFSAMKETGHLDFLVVELETAMGLEFQEMLKLVDALNNNMPYHEILKTINNIDSNCEYLAKKIDELKGNKE